MHEFQKKSKHLDYTCVGHVPVPIVELPATKSSLSQFTQTKQTSCTMFSIFSTRRI